MIRSLEKRGWGIINGLVRADKDEEYTFTEGNGNTVINYVVGDEEMWEEIRKLEIGEGVESDHPHRMIVAMKKVGQERGRGEKKRRIWDEGGNKKFHGGNKERRGGIKQKWGRMQRKVKEAVE